MTTEDLPAVFLQMGIDLTGDVGFGVASDTLQGMTKMQVFSACGMLDEAKMALKKEWAAIQAGKLASPMGTTV